ncbi:DUF3986 family protein [Salipaludibacillus neizhouensis]|uniref:DUF3986 family protein n=1 Tax=Salipaludibacillus neizhouensis TaxID=885475 RepID=UPI00167EF702|nr:DUF3986 family protein [Salipaludibacillus neizhouensis]
MLFDQRYHLHVGYYDNSKDIEAICLKVLNEDIWCMFLDNDFYKLPLPGSDYPSLESFGLLIGIFNFTTKEMSYDIGAKLFEDFLKTENII